MYYLYFNQYIHINKSTLMGNFFSTRSISDINRDICIDNNLFPVYDWKTKINLQNLSIELKKIDKSANIQFQEQDGPSIVHKHPLDMKWINNNTPTQFKEINGCMVPMQKKTIKVEDFLYILVLPQDIKLSKDTITGHSYHLFRKIQDTGKWELLYMVYPRIGLGGAGIDNEFELVAVSK